MKLSEKAMRAAGLDPAARPDQAQLEKRLSRNVYRDGPMAFIGRQIVRRMGDKGWPCKISEHYRTPQRQAELMRLGRSKAGPWRSPHQYGLAVDVIHQFRGWDVPERFWTDLAGVVKVVEGIYDVDLEHGHTWKFRDSAHVELKDFRTWRDRWGPRCPTQAELDECFAEVLPRVWKDYQARCC